MKIITKRYLKYGLLLMLPIVLGWYLREQKSWQPHKIIRSADVGDMLVSPDGDILLILGRQTSNGNLLFATKTGQLKQHFYAGPFSSLACFSPDSKQIVFGGPRSGETSDLTFNDIQTGRTIFRTETPGLDFNGYDDAKLVWRSASAQLIALGSKCFVWDTKSKTTVRKLTLSSDMLSDIEISPDGKMIAGVNKTDFRFVYPGGKVERRKGVRKGVRLWDARDGELLRTLDQAHQSRYCIEFSHDGSLLASDVTPQDNKMTVAIQLWNPRTGQLLRNLTIPKAFSKAYAMQFSLQFAPDDNRLAFVGAGPTILLWNADTGKLLKTIKIKGKSEIANFRFLPNGDYLVVATFDGTITRRRIR